MIEAPSAERPPAKVMEDYRLSPTNGRYAQAAAYVRAHPCDLPVRQDLTRGRRTPMLVPSGGTDPLAPAANGAFERPVPHCCHELLKSAHFLWEDPSTA